MNNDINITLNEQKISIENEIEQENKNILRYKSLLKKVKRNLKNKYTFLIINSIFYIICNFFKLFSIKFNLA